MRTFLQEHLGFTLPEVLVSVAIITVIMSTVGMAISQALGTQKTVVEDGLAINELRKGFSWFAEDAKMAQSTSLTDGGPAASSVTMNWTDQFAGAGTPHTVTYSLVGGELVRTYDGNSHVVGHRVASVEFSFSGRVITAQMVANVGNRATRTLSVEALMRIAPQ